MANFFDFSSDKINIFAMLIDSSGSMERHSNKVRRGLELYKDSFEDFPEANSIAVAVSMFSDSFYPGEFKRVSEFDTTYYTEGATALFYSIVKGAEHLNNYIKEVTERTGCIPRVTFIVFSDGEPCHDRMNKEDGRKAINDLNYAGVTTVFVAFGNAINSEFGKKLGFMSTIDVADAGDSLVNFLGVELSKSCKEQSKSLKALGENFFSKAVNNGNSEEYSHTTTQALEDDSWFNDI